MTAHIESCGHPISAGYQQLHASHIFRLSWNLPVLHLKNTNTGKRHDKLKRRIHVLSYLFMLFSVIDDDFDCFKIAPSNSNPGTVDELISAVKLYYI